VTEVNPDDVRRQHRYELLTWPEINEAVAQSKVIVVPVGSIEQHGHHLPLDVDSKLVNSVCDAAGGRAPELMLVMPTMSYGYCHHVMDFPGTITIQPVTFVNVLLDIVRSVAYLGFKRIVIVNGHGSNHSLVEQAGRQVNLQTDAVCCTLSWCQLAPDYWNSEVRESGPEGCAHACELETSMYLSLDPDGVHTDHIRGALSRYMTDIPDGDRWQWTDLTLGGGPATIIGWTSSFSHTGTIGSPELATAEKGTLAFTHSVDRLVSLINWMRHRPLETRHSAHAVPPTFPLPFGF